MVVTSIAGPGGTPIMARSINDAGQIVGNDSAGAFLLSDGLFRDIDFPGMAATTPVDINNAGQIVGYYYTRDFISRGVFLYDHGVFSTISGADGVSGINNAGEILVGMGSTFGVYTNGVFNKIDVLGNPAINSLAGFNDYGEFGGAFYDGSVLVRGFLATPTTVPEPTSVALLMIGLPLGSMLALRRQPTRASRKRVTRTT